MDKPKKMPKNLKASKQLTLDRLPLTQKKESPKTTAIIQEKQVVIKEIGSLTKKDELALVKSVSGIKF
jgi:hypothetical protein